MSGTTNVGQKEEIELRIIQFIENERNLTIAERQAKNYAVKLGKFKEYLEQNGAVEVQVYPNKTRKEPNKTNNQAEEISK